MEDIGDKPLKGWIQIGDIHGAKFGVWVKVINGHSVSISLGKETREYWKQIGVDMYGRNKTLEGAAKSLEKEANKLDIGGYVPIDSPDRWAVIDKTIK